MYIKMSSMKCMKRFGKKGKLSLRYIRPHKIMEIIDLVVYRVVLLLEYWGVHDVFHVFLLRNKGRVSRSRSPKYLVQMLFIYN